MNKNTKTTTVLPRYRFPEFSQFKAWQVEYLGNVTYAISRKNTKGDKYPVYSINNKEGFLPQAEQFEGVDSNSRGYDISLYKIVGKNTFAYNPARINIGSIGYSGDLHDIIISSLYVCFKTNEGINDRFFQHFLSTSIFYKQVENKAEGGIRSYLFYENFSNILSAFPDIREQEKIADCLTSIDDLITAENKKLETLKTNKKGLMQKLFPAEGKTVPEWRFPEFKNSGEWEISPFETFVKLYRGSSPRPIQKFLIKKGGVNWIKIGDTKNADGFKICSVEEQITHGGAQKSRFVTVGELILANSMSYGKTYEVQIDGCIYDGWFVLREYEEYFDKKFLLQQLNSDNMQKQYLTLAAGGIVQNISSDIVYSTVLKRPTLEEQQKIADCLSALDELITAHTKKIETLKLHKKGFMQGLFPSVQEVIK